MRATIRDTVLGIRSETVTNTYLIVRCARCRYEFEVQTREERNPRTVRCKRYGCGRVCHLDTADRVPEALPDGVVPIRRPA